MTDEEARLCAAIYAAPDDDGPRAAYAAWLLAQGAPLGHFIDAQLRGDTAAAATHHPAAVAAQPIPVLGAPPPNAFVRGFLTACLTSGQLALPRASHDAWRLVTDLRLAEPQAAELIEAVGPRWSSLRTLDTERGDPAAALARVRPRPLDLLRVRVMESWIDLTPLIDERTVVEVGLLGVCEVRRDPGRVHLSPPFVPFNGGPVEAVLRAVVRPEDEVSFVFMGDRAPVDAARRALESIPHKSFTEHPLMIVS